MFFYYPSSGASIVLRGTDFSLRANESTNAIARRAKQRRRASDKRLVAFVPVWRPKASLHSSK